MNFDRDRTSNSAAIHAHQPLGRWFPVQIHSHLAHAHLFTAAGLGVVRCHGQCYCQGSRQIQSIRVRLRSDPAGCPKDGFCFAFSGFSIPNICPKGRGPIVNNSSRSSSVGKQTCRRRTAPVCLKLQPKHAGQFVFSTMCGSCCCF